MPLHEGSQTFDVLSVGGDQKFTPTVTILKDGESECFRLPNELSEWACSVRSLIQILPGCLKSEIYPLILLIAYFELIR